jgi:hypothetical protein
LRDVIAKILDGTTLADVCARAARLGRGSGGHVTTDV